MLNLPVRAKSIPMQYNQWIILIAECNGINKSYLAVQQSFSYKTISSLFMSTPLQSHSQNFELYFWMINVFL